MDHARFDHFARNLGRSVSRRTGVGALVAAVLTSVAPAVDTEASKKKRKCKAPRKKCGKKCVAITTDRSNCGSCNRKCEENQTCTNGGCTANCPAGQRPCRGACLAATVCCVDTDCPPGRTCQVGVCACPPDQPYTCPGSTACRQCCTKADCTTSTSTADHVPTCSATGVCTCARPGTRYCPARRTCGSCCADSECTGGQQCNQFPAEADMCTCNLGSQSTCTAAGRTGCISPSGQCNIACNTACSEQDPVPCECAAELVCTFDPNNIPDGYRCAPR